jgi:hypothetical protein
MDIQVANYLSIFHLLLFLALYNSMFEGPYIILWIVNISNGRWLLLRKHIVIIGCLIASLLFPRNRYYVDLVSVCIFYSIACKSSNAVVIVSYYFVSL